jgi:hypothetical protein
LKSRTRVKQLMVKAWIDYYLTRFLPFFPDNL